jgi:hypothetical protein
MPIARWLVLAGVPAVVCMVIFAGEAGLGNWTALPQIVRFGAIVDTLLVDTVLALLGASLAGVLAATSPLPGPGGPARTPSRAGRHVTATLMMATFAFVAGSAAVCAAGWGISSESLRAIAASHATLAAGALMLAAFGFWCSTVFQNPLDAVACSAVCGLLVSGGIVAAGPAMTDAPGKIVTAALISSPVVNTAAAAGVDLFRTELLYQISPLAHMTLDYPAWPLAAGLYLLVAAAFFGFAAARTRRAAHEPHTH